MNNRKFSQNKAGDKSATHMPLISQNTLVYDRKNCRHITYLHFYSLYLKLLISQSQLSGIRKDTSTYRLSEINFVFEISRADCKRQKYSFSVYSIINLLTYTRTSSYRRTAMKNKLKIDMTQHRVISIHSKGR